MARPLSGVDPQSNGANGDLAARILRDLNLDPSVMHSERQNLDTMENASLGTDSGEPVTGNSAAELAHLRDENQQLRGLISELEHHLEGLTGPGSTDAARAHQTKEMESLLEEKSEVIRGMHAKIVELQEDMAKVHEELAKTQEELAKKPAPRPITPQEEEVIRIHEENERERRQLQEDEESMMKQMREMEIQMAKERAEIARQRNEMQRLHAEIRHELELAARDSALRERLAPLQRRHQDVMIRRGSSPGAQSNGAAAPGQAPSQSGEQTGARKESGLLRRLFR